MKLVTIGCIFYHEFAKADGSEVVPVEVHFAPITDSAEWMIAIKVGSKLIESYATHLSANYHNAHNFAWQCITKNNL
jgi:hypothetical protein